MKTKHRKAIDDTEGEVPEIMGCVFALIVLFAIFLVFAIPIFLISLFFN